MPDQHAFGDQGSPYEQKVRELFEEGFRPSVSLKVLILESFATESLIGIQKVSDGLEVFHLRAKSSIADTEMLEAYEAGNVFGLDRNGNRIPGVETKEYQDLKRKTPSDFREIPIEKTSRILPKRTAHEITDMWKAMLLGTHYPKKGRFGKDGTTYFFSMWDNFTGRLSGMVWSPSDASPTGRLVHLTNSMQRYVHQEITEAELKGILKQTRLRLGLATR